MSKSCLVTGGCGFIGSNLVHDLVDKGWKVDVVDDMSNGQLEFLEGLSLKVVPGFLVEQYEKNYESDRKPGTVLVIEADIEHEAVLGRVRNGKYERVFHLAANPRVTQSVEQPASTTDVNCTRTLSLLEAVRACETPLRFIFSSTCAMYGEVEKLPVSETHPIVPISPYGLQKRFVEEYIRIACDLHGLDAVCLRYFNVYGPRQVAESAYATSITAWCGKVKSGGSLRSDGDGEQSRDMVYVGDVVRANVLAATREEGFNGECINIGSGKRYTNNQVLGMFMERFNGLSVHGAPPRPGDIRHMQADITLARELLAYVPQVDFRTGLEKTWQWWGL